MTNLTKKLDVCLIGCGRMGSLHAESIAAHKSIGRFTVVDPELETARSLAKKHGALTATMDQVFDQKFDAVIVASPPHLHLEHTLKAAETGAYVFCEKPLGKSFSAILEAMPELEIHADRVQLGFNRRFDPHMAELKRRLVADEIGPIEQLSIVSRDHHAPTMEGLENSAGLIAETAIHDFDMVRWLLDCEVDEIFCSGAALVNPSFAEVDHIDTATMVLSTSKGQQVVIQNSWRTAYGYDQRVEAFGPRGRLNVNNPRGQRVELESVNGQIQPLIADDWSDRYVESYSIEMRAFLDAASRGEKVSPNLLDGMRASLLAERAQQSLNSNRPVGCVL